MKPLLSYFFKATLVVIVLFIIASFAGCRQEPANKVKYYEAELQKMRAAKQNEVTAQQQRYIKDGYPWRGKSSRMETLPCRINQNRYNIQQELNYLDEAIRGKKKKKLQLRD